MFDEFLKFSHSVEKRANALTSEMIKELEACREALTGKLASLEDRYLKREFNDETYSRRKKLLEHQRSETEKVLSGVYRNIQVQVEEAGQDVIQATTKHAISTMNNALDLSVKFFHLDETAVKAWVETSSVEGLVLNDWLKKLESNAVDRIIKCQRQAMLQGLSVGQATKLLRENGFEGSYSGLQGLSRTLLHSAANYSREKTLIQGFDRYIQGWRYCATLDSRSCIACASLDGQIYKKDELKPNLPLHFRCRCTYIPEIKPLVVKGVEVKFPRGDRPAVTGSGADYKVERWKGDYNSWLKHMLEKDEAFVKDVLGKTRFDLFKSGKLSLDGMVSEGKIIKLSDL